MNREEKKLQVEELKKKQTETLCAILADYRGLSVEEMQGLRSKVYENNHDMKVIKNRLAKIAWKETEWEVLNEDLTGPILVGFSSDDPVPLAKAFVDVAKQEDSKLELKVGILRGKKLSVDELKSLAALPSREVLLGQLLNVLLGPARGLVTVLSGVQREFVQVLQAVATHKEENPESVKQETKSEEVKSEEVQENKEENKSEETKKEE